MNRARFLRATAAVVAIQFLPRVPKAAAAPAEQVILDDFTRAAPQFGTWSGPPLIRTVWFRTDPETGEMVELARDVARYTMTVEDVGCRITAAQVAEDLPVQPLGFSSIAEAITSREVFFTHEIAPGHLNLQVGDTASVGDDGSWRLELS